MKLLRTLIIAIIVGGLILGAALPVLAAPDKEGKEPLWQAGEKPLVIRGVVEDINGNTLKVAGKDIHLSNDTIYRVPGLGREAGRDDIKKGMQVAVLVAEKNKNQLWAKQVVVLPAKRPFQHFVGKVTAYAYDPASGGNITVENRAGNELEFKIVDGKFKIVPAGATPKVDDWVTVVGYRQPEQNQLIAIGVAIHQQVPWFGLKRVHGVITNINKGQNTITIDTTELTYNERTVFTLRGLLEVKNDQTATAFYLEQNGTKLAKLVLVGIDLPGIRTELGKLTADDVPKVALKDSPEMMRPQKTVR